VFWKGRSVASSWVTAYCSGVSLPASASALGFLKVIAFHPLAAVWADALVTAASSNPAARSHVLARKAFGGLIQRISPVRVIWCAY
jgi:hypothetical protein